jgi:Ni,Fe-hydrogenase maturation factor
LVVRILVLGLGNDLLGDGRTLAQRVWELLLEWTAKA